LLTQNAKPPISQIASRAASKSNFFQDFMACLDHHMVVTRPPKVGMHAC